MNIAIVSNFAGKGLEIDFQLLRDYLQEQGHQVTGVQYDTEHSEAYDLAIYLEVVPLNLIGLAPVRWAFLNPEWVKPEIQKAVERHVDKIFAKTREAQRIFSPLFPGRVHYTGFLARNQYDPTVERKKKFLHQGGDSSLRGTQELIDAWKWTHKEGEFDAALASELVVVGKSAKNLQNFNALAPAIGFIERLEDDELKRLQNECLFHIYPSKTEGFGHAIHEAFSVGAVVVLTDAPPMNEADNAAMYIPTYGKVGKYNLADIYGVSAIQIFKMVRMLERDVSGTQTSIEALSELIREHFLAANELFKALFVSHLEELSPKPATPQIRLRRPGATRIAFLGNFKADESTENFVRLALEELGVEVDALQENETNYWALKNTAEHNDAFLWVRTPGWTQISEEDMLRFLDDAHKRGMKTLSLHLDKFWGIPDREKLIGLTPFWKTQHAFTADGSDQPWASRGVNHHWMKPAVSEIYCHKGRPWDMYRCDVGFVGAREYHEEYPFRRQLVEFLEQTYGERFKHITNIRGHALNDFYASCRVVVGDCIFAGLPRYWSDRAPETCGRYGNLVHPFIEGFDIPCYVYGPQDLESLKEVIGATLAMDENSRKNMIRLAAEYVQQNDTWTIRMGQILRTVDL
jgi:hypothetical protein